MVYLLPVHQEGALDIRYCPGIERKAEAGDSGLTTLHVAFDESMNKNYFQ